MAAGVVGSLVAQIEDELDALVAAIGHSIREEIPDFRRLPSETLGTAIRGNVSRALAALRELRDPTADELERAAAIGTERAEQGLTVDAVLHAYRISIPDLQPGSASRLAADCASPGPGDPRGSSPCPRWRRRMKAPRCDS